MSLGIMIKGSEGVVLAADSRVTLLTQMQPQPAPNAPANAPLPPSIVIPATFDNATKVLKVNGQSHVGAVTYGIGAIMTANGPRTMRSFIPEFEQELEEANVGRLSVSDFANRLSEFFMGQWNQHVNHPVNPGEEINFLVGGYDEGAPYGRAFSFVVPTQVVPLEQNPGPGQFGITWGGQHDLVFRLLYGFDMELLEFVRANLNLTPQQLATLKQQMEPKFAAGIPYQFLSLQDSVDLAIFLIQSTISFQKFRTTVVRGVGGPVEVATITRDGFKFVSQKKSISAEGDQP
jgi:hypothetical protein